MPDPDQEEVGELSSHGDDRHLDVDGYLTGSPLATPELVDAADILTAASRSRPAIEAWVTGTGSPVVNAERAGPSSVLRCGEDVILIDCGNCTAYQAIRLGIAPSAISHIFITHHHLDHVADLPFVLMVGWATKTAVQTPTIVGPRGTFEFVRRVLYAYDYDVRVRIPQGYDASDLRPRVVEIDDGHIIDGGNWRVTAFRVNHLPVDQAFGYRFEGTNASVVFSGDTRPCENLIEHSRGADVLVHEVLQEGHGYPEYHTLSTDVGRIAAEAGVGRLVLNHLIPHNRPDHEWVADIEPDYTGAITVGRDLLQIC